MPMDTLSTSPPSSTTLAHLDSGISLPALLARGTWQSSMGRAFTAISKSEASLKVPGQSDIVTRRNIPPHQPHPQPAVTIMTGRVYPESPPCRCDQQLLTIPTRSGSVISYPPRGHPATTIPLAPKAEAIPHHPLLAHLLRLFHDHQVGTISWGQRSLAEPGFAMGPLSPFPRQRAHTTCSSLPLPPHPSNTRAGQGTY